jgi:hypothetical protein
MPHETGSPRPAGRRAAHLRSEAGRTDQRRTRPRTDKIANPSNTGPGSPARGAPLEPGFQEVGDGLAGSAAVLAGADLADKARFEPASLGLGRGGDHKASKAKQPQAVDLGRCARREGFEPPTARSVAWCSASTWSAPDGSGLLRLGASSVQTDLDRSCRIVWMIKRMIKRVGQFGEPAPRRPASSVGRRQPRSVFDKELV